MERVNLKNKFFVKENSGAKNQLRYISVDFYFHFKSTSFGEIVLRAPKL